MKFMLFAAIAALPFSNQKCQKEKFKADCFKGRLEIKGICSNYTIKLVDGSLESSKTVANWKDEITGKAYTNVFALGNPCTFPDSLKEGDEFYFTVDNRSRSECAVCMAFYPKPEKALSIKVLDKPCK